MRQETIFINTFAFQRGKLLVLSVGIVVSKYTSFLVDSHQSKLQTLADFLLVSTVLKYTPFVVDSHQSKLQTVGSQCRQWSRNTLPFWQILTSLKLQTLADFLLVSTVFEYTPFVLEPNSWFPHILQLWQILTTLSVKLLVPTHSLCQIVKFKLNLKLLLSSYS